MYQTVKSDECIFRERDNINHSLEICHLPCITFVASVLSSYAKNNLNRRAAGSGGSPGASFRPYYHVLRQINAPSNPRGKLISISTFTSNSSTVTANEGQNNFVDISCPRLFKRMLFWIHIVALSILQALRELLMEQITTSTFSIIV